MKDYRFKLEFDVRDYECDLAGMVNNAIYQHYLEHARHVFLKSQGIDFQDWVQRGISLIVIRIEMDFLWPLHSGDRFFVGLNTERVSRLRFGLLQDIYRLPDEKPVLQARVIGSAVNAQGRPQLPPELAALIDSGFPPAGKTP
jgi:acyl-CoA thioester hydrolase